MRTVCSVSDAWKQAIHMHGQPLNRSNILLEASDLNPFLGEPAPLLANLSGYWSRCIAEANRLLCRATDDEFIVMGCRYHYGGAEK